MSPQRLVPLLLAAFLALGVTLIPATLLAQEPTYSASLSGSGAVPAVSTDASGTFTATVDLATGAVSYALKVPSISGTTAAHIHAGAADENGPVVLALFAAEAPGASSIDVTATAGAADLVGPFAGDPLGFVAALLAGNLYVNVHTVANPGGEIRGQLQMFAVSHSPEPGAIAPPASGNAAIASPRSSGSSTELALVLVATAVVLTAAGRAATRRWLAP